MALGNIVLTASVIVLYCVGCIKSEGWTPTSFREVSNYSRSQDISTPSSSRISGKNNHRDVTSSNFHPTRRDMNSRAMQITATTEAARVTTDHHLQDATANSFYPSRRDWTKQAAEDDSNSSIPVTTQEYPGHRDYYPSRRERPQQKVEKLQVRLHGVTVFRYVQPRPSIRLNCFSIRMLCKSDTVQSGPYYVHLWNRLVTRIQNESMITA